MDTDAGASEKLGYYFLWGGGGYLPCTLVYWTASTGTYPNDITICYEFPGLVHGLVGRTARVIDYIMFTLCVIV